MATPDSPRYLAANGPIPPCPSPECAATGCDCMIEDHHSFDPITLPKLDRWATDWTTEAERTHHRDAVVALAKVRCQLNDLVASFRQPTLDLEFEDAAERLLLERAC